MPGGYYHHPARITHRRGTRINARWFWSVITAGFVRAGRAEWSLRRPENCLNSLVHVPWRVVSGLALLAAVVCAALAAEIEVSTASLPDGVVGVPYRARLEARGGKPPYRWSLYTPGLPEELALDAAGGEITGRPSGPITAYFTIAVADSGTPPQSATRLFTLRVAGPLALLTAALPPGSYAAPYNVRLEAGGGIPPYRWELARGALPPGLRLNRESGVLSGTLATQGDFGFTVRVTDSAKPPQIQTRELSTRIPPPLAVGWVRPPVLNAGGIAGSVQVLNGTRNTVDLTLIVVAVNEYGKAFTLGYQHLPLAPFRYTVEIPFGASLPRGRYTVHADAVSEYAPTVTIHRARLQAGPFVVMSDE